MAQNPQDIKPNHLLWHVAHLIDENTRLRDVVRKIALRKLSGESLKSLSGKTLVSLYDTIIIAARTWDAPSSDADEVSPADKNAEHVADHLYHVLQASDFQNMVVDDVDLRILSGRSRISLRFRQELIARFLAVGCSVVYNRPLLTVHLSGATQRRSISYTDLVNNSKPKAIVA